MAEDDMMREVEAVAIVAAGAGVGHWTSAELFCIYILF